MTDQELYDLYLKNVAAYCAGVKLDGKKPDEKFMQKFESGMPEHMVHACRNNLMRRYATDMILHGKHDWRQDKEVVYVVQQIVGGG